MTINNTETGKEQEIFVTSDLALAAALSIYYPVIRINKENPRKAKFIFAKTKDLDELINWYWQKKLLVEPRQYSDQLKALKARLYGNE